MHREMVCLEEAVLLTPCARRWGFGDQSLAKSHLIASKMDMHALSKSKGAPARTVSGIVGCYASEVVWRLLHVGLDHARGVERLYIMRMLHARLSHPQWKPRDRKMGA